MKLDTRYECLNKKCGTHLFGTGKNMDGLNCPRCDGPVVPKPFEKSGPSNCGTRIPVETDVQRIGDTKPPEKTLAVYRCLCCDHEERIRGNKDEYSELKVCPKCNGAFVDIWMIGKYIKKDKEETKLFDKEITIKKELLDVIEALDKLDKKYVITKSQREVPDVHYAMNVWHVKEV
jgi:Zn-finger nucleic acid-binding protein